jgi:Tfp pilus assembly protein PilF
MRITKTFTTTRPDPASGTRWVWLILVVLLTATRGVGQTGPLSIEDLKHEIAIRSLTEVSTLVMQRRISFVPTAGVKLLLEAEAKNAPGFDPSGWEKVLEALDSRAPTELIVAIAEFFGGERREKEELQIAIRSHLEKLGAPQGLVRIEPVPVGATIRRDQEARTLGNQQGYHIVVWGDWRTENHQTRVQPRISIVGIHRAVTVREGVVQDDDLRLEAEGLDVIESAAIKTSSLVGSLIALSYCKKNDFAKAGEIFKATQASDAEVSYNLGTCAYSAGNYEKAETYFTSAVAADRKFVKAIHNLGTVLYATARYEGAIDLFRRALEIDPNSAKTLNNLGIALIELEKYETGLDSLISATKKDPGNETAWYNYGAALLRLGHYKTAEALEAFKRYLALQEKDHATWFLCAELSLRTLTNMDESRRSHHVEEGKTFLLKAIDIDPGNEEYLRSYMDLIPWTVSREDLERYDGFIASLPKTSRSKKIEELRNEMLATKIRILMGLSEYEKARATFRELVIPVSSLRDCDDRLLYKLASEQLLTFSQSAFARKFYTATYEYFLRTYFDKALGSASKKWFDTYVELLRENPSDLSSLIAKGLLQFKVLQLNRKVWVDYGFRREGDDEEEWKGRFFDDANQTLETALKITRNRALKKDLSECLDELRQ